MHVPAEFSIKDTTTALDFIRQYSFGALICNGEAVPEVSHLPFLVKEEEDALYLHTHFARANPQLKKIEEVKQVLVVFSGPHSYISPTWYVNKINVPTWNYSVVHVNGTAETIHGTEAKKQLLLSTLSCYEPSFIQDYEKLPDQFKNAMFTELVGIKIKVNSIQTNFKLSQNKSREDIRSVIERLQTSTDTNDVALAGLMLKFNDKKLKP